MPKLKDYYNGLNPIKEDDSDSKTGFLGKMIASILFLTISGKVNKAKERFNNDLTLNYAIDKLKKSSDEVAEIIKDRYSK